MGGLKIRRFKPSKQSWALITPLISLLVVSMCWNLRQSQLIAKERLRSEAAQREERTHARETAERAEALKNKNAKWASSDARLQELYREIDSLSRLNEQVFSHPHGQFRKPTAIDSPAETLSAP